MANTFIKPSVIARMAYANLYNNVVMAGLVHRDFEGDFRGKQGDTITVRKPSTFTANEYVRANGITVQDANETSFTVTLDTILDVSFEVTAEELTMDLDSFEEQFIAPAAEAFAQKVDNLLITKATTDTTQTVGAGVAAATDPKAILDARKVLNDNAVPLSERYGVWNTASEAAFLKDPLFHQADQRGDTEGLREASIGRKFGADHFVDQNLGSVNSLYFHRSAFALVMRTLALPRGIGEGQGAVIGGKGMGLRVVQSYDIDRKADVISLDVLLGVATLDADRSVKVTAA